MQEYSRILIEDYCAKHSKTQKSKILSYLVGLSYDVNCDVGDWEAVQLSHYIQLEKNEELKEALVDLQDFLFPW